jgi:transposase
MEATGVYHEQLTHYLHRLDAYVSVLLPNKVKSFAQSFNEHSKTDAIDALVIARFTAQRLHKCWKPASEQMNYMRALTRQRQSFVEDRTTTKNRLHAIKHGADKYAIIVEQYEQHISHLDQLIKRLDTEIRSLKGKDEQLEMMMNRLETITGIGMITSATVLSEMDAFQLFERRSQVVKFVGFDVLEKQSGSSIKGKGKISKRGNSRVRRILHVAAMAAVRHEGPIRQLYLRVVERTGIKKKGLVAAARKLLVLSYALTKNETDYDLDRHQKGVGRNKPTHSAYILPEQELLKV